MGRMGCNKGTYDTRSNRIESASTSSSASPPMMPAKQSA